MLGRPSYSHGLVFVMYSTLSGGHHFVYRLDHHLQMRLVLGHFEEGGGYLCVPFRDHFRHDPLKERAVLAGNGRGGRR